MEINKSRKSLLAPQFTQRSCQSQLSIMTSHSHFYSITELKPNYKKKKKSNTWTYIGVIKSTYNGRNHLWKQNIWSEIELFSLSHVPLDNMERAGFMTYAGTSHLGAIETRWLHFWGLRMIWPISRHIGRGTFILTVPRTHQAPILNRY